MDKEIYAIETASIPVELDDSINYHEVLPDISQMDESADIDDYQKLAASVQQKEKPGDTTASVQQPISQPKHIYRNEDLFDFCMNLFIKHNMKDTMATFQTEYHALNKKDAFHSKNLGPITDIKSKNTHLKEEVKRIEEESKKTENTATESKSVWEKLRKERDFHKTNFTRIQGEKKILNENIKKLKEICTQFDERIDELGKKYESTIKEKSLLKLERDKQNKKVSNKQEELKSLEKKVSDEINGVYENIIPQKPIPKDDWPEEARPNPYINKKFEEFNSHATILKSFEGHPKPIGALAIHSRKDIIATGSDDKTWKIWNMSNCEQIMSAEGCKGWISSVDFHPSGTHLVTGSSDCAIKLWDFEKQCCVLTYTEHTQNVMSAKFHDTGFFILSSSLDNSIKLFDLRTKKNKQVYRSHTDSVNKVAFQPFTNYFASASSDRTVSIWDIRTGLTIQTFYGHMNSVNDVMFNYKGDVLASCDGDGMIKLWDIINVKEIEQFDVGKAVINAITFDRSGHYLFSGQNDGVISQINLETKEISKLASHKESITGVVISHTNQELYSVSSDKEIKIWK